MTNTSKKAVENVSLETTIKSLENLVEQLENEGTSLEDSLTAFEVGIELTRKAQQALSEAEQKVRLLLEDNDIPEDVVTDSSDDRK